jgi:hypothetical protein
VYLPPTASDFIASSSSTSVVSVTQQQQVITAHPTTRSPRTPPHHQHPHPHHLPHHLINATSLSSSLPHHPGSTITNTTNASRKTET